MKKEDPFRMYQEIQDHFKGCKLHHVEAARRALEAHRFGPEIEQDLSRLMELIAVLEKAQKMPMPESQKFGILKIIMAHEERPHVRAVYGMASYNKESQLYLQTRLRTNLELTSTVCLCTGARLRKNIP